MEAAEKKGKKDNLYAAFPQVVTRVKMSARASLSSVSRPHGGSFCSPHSVCVYFKAISIFFCYCFMSNQGGSSASLAREKLAD